MLDKVKCPDCKGKGYYSVTDAKVNEWLKPYNNPTCQTCDGAKVVYIVTEG